MKVYIKTYGCQMNERDSEALAGMLTARGHEITDSETEADAMIFNTCSVRDQAERKAVGKIGFMKKNKQVKPHLIIGVIGCMAQRRGEELLETLPHLDFVLGTGKLQTLPDLLESIAGDRRRVSETGESAEVLTGMGAHWMPEQSWGAQIAITRGCNRFCSYCIVPYVRGREISRDAADILEEAKMLVSRGIREILLLGQNVAAYGLGGDLNPPRPGYSPFGDLLEQLAAIDGLHRIRFTSPYPTYFNDRLIDVIASEPKICRCIHLPLQSGSDPVLKRMNRQYTAARYEEIVAALRERMPEMAFSTDVIVGFPGETDEDFVRTRDLMNRVGFDNAFIFKYSPRPGTRSAAGEDNVPQAVKEERNRLLLEDLAARTAAKLQAMVGTETEALAEGPSRRMPERWTGRTGTGRTVNFPPFPGIAVGDLVKLKLLRAGNIALYGEVAGHQS